MRNLIFCLLFATAASAQYTAINGSTDAPANSVGLLNTKLAFLPSGGAQPSTCVSGKEVWVDGSTPPRWFLCVATNTFAEVLNGGQSYANPAWITSLAYSKLTGVPSFITNPLVAAGDFLIGGASGVPTRLVVPGNGTFCPSWSSGAVTWITCPGAGGGLSSVGLTMPSGFTVGGSPLTVNGTLAVTLGSQTGSFALIAPTGGGVPTWRAMVKADIPATTIYSDQANSYTAGMKQTFTSSSTTAALNFAPYAGDPSTLFDGDHWYNSSSGLFKARIASTTKTFATIDGNIATASAFASTPSLCSTGFAPTGVLANGNATGCAALGGSGAQFTSNNLTVTANVLTTITHSLGNANVILSCTDHTTHAAVQLNWASPTTNTVTFTPALNEVLDCLVTTGGVGPAGPTGPSGGTNAPVVVASLPACNSGSAGTYYGVTDALSTLVGATISGGGTGKAAVYCNATNWILVASNVAIASPSGVGASGNIPVSAGSTSAMSSFTPGTGVVTFLGTPTLANLNTALGVVLAPLTANQSLRTPGAYFSTASATTVCANVPYAGTITGMKIWSDATVTGTVTLGSVAFGSFTGAGSASTAIGAGTITAGTNASPSIAGWTNTTLAANTMVCYTPSAITAGSATYLVAQLQIAAN